ncbi:MarR family transcriptional regulator [Actinocrinis puniceicyclus]|uniref:MarR family transcriptional regulator n=1 Tax=Actinocrinis puniceicyclus TaxID=977794 RepID=A0A8J8BDM9_9ACTN|nr:MarR family transcriptional regulator [Actinocrinis puniceicyclus]MBS2964341.1 MarR family transcriptional regulator [Actinocrinis puniceicyclus]
MSRGAAEADAAAHPAPARPDPAADPAGIPTGFEHNFGWLLGQCFRAYTEAVELAVADLPHGHRGFQALYGAANCSAHNQAELAKQLGVDRTVMVYLVDDLEKAGLAERVADPNDRRSRLIRATESGRARLADAQRAISAAEAQLLATLSQDQQKSLHRMLCSIAAHHRMSGPGGPPCQAAGDSTPTPC